MSNKMPNGVALEFVSCPNGCLVDDEFILSSFDMMNGVPGDYYIYRCRHCSLERTNPRPTSETIGLYYPDNYAPYKSDDVSGKNYKESIKNFFRALLGLRSRILPSVNPGRMLEIGCSSGSYMQQARLAGWIIEGIEFSPKAAAVARSKGFSVQTGALEQVISLHSEYDMIVGWMVLEHLHEPVTALRKLRSWIRYDGYLVMSLPSAESLSRKFFGRYSYDLHLPNHLFHYTPKTLAKTFDNSGWKIERVFWQRNCNPLLMSFEYWCVGQNRLLIAKIVRWFRVGTLTSPLRVMLSLLLGVTHQSGRIEVWARPV